jgi:hypothetical protein
MALPPLPANNTARYRVNYSVGGVQHSFQIRSLASPSTIGAHINSYMTALSPGLSLTSIDTVEFAVSGSDVYNLVTTGAEGGIFGTGVPPTINDPLAINFIGRTTGGRRVRRAQFGWKDLAGNFRYFATENGTADAAIAVLAGAGSLIMGIDGLTPVWKTYSNVKFFDHWVKVIR